MDFPARALADHAVLVVYHIEELVVHTGLDLGLRSWVMVTN